METERSLTYSEEPATALYPEADESNQQPLIIIYYSPGLPTSLFPSNFLANTKHF
jgi:hypothetical protein